MSVAGVTWFARELWIGMKELRHENKLLREEVHLKYVAKDDFNQHRHDFREGLNELKVIMHRIFEKLESKADK